jgi:hypothetical protein
MPNKGFLLVLMQPPGELEEEFNDWYDTDHIPERLGVPGFETGRRFVCLDGWPRYLALYDLSDLAVLDTPAYQRVAGDNQTAWTRRILRRVRVTRVVGTQHFPGDCITSDAPRLLLLRFRNTTAQDEAPLLAGLHANFLNRPNTVQIRLLAGDSAAHFALIESRLPFAPATLDLEAFGPVADRLDLINSYARM